MQWGEVEDFDDLIMGDVEDTEGKEEVQDDEDQDAVGNQNQEPPRRMKKRAQRKTKADPNSLLERAA